ncbi:uncharacterized protein LOC106636869 [Copidosoma floridanum]|uniref:uncharacterized protein LOC106636869 n=1 Tax=Copidosoma floridanum TaxID=29053 RepID=UPI0006C9629C|nr:uncharacterized protein LOC106636869 [Copidosoma floridanum]XP_014204900.1 uncharacterized protein LOC106636869 [Copidosoma floridanum]
MKHQAISLESAKPSAAEGPTVHGQMNPEVVVVDPDEKIFGENAPEGDTKDPMDTVPISSLEDLDEAIMKKIDKAESLDDWLEIRSQLKVERSNENVRKVTLYVKDRLDKLPEGERRQWARNVVTALYRDILPESLIDLLVGQFFPGDSGVDVDARPDWLDLDKFRRGQKFAVKYLSSICYADFLSLVVVFSFQDALKPLVVTGASSTPYAAFNRYYSTAERVRNWYLSDPWTPGTSAYNDVRAVRKMHACVRKRLQSMSPEELAERSRIRHPWCPSLDLLKEDFQSTCPAPAPGQCPYEALTEYPELKFNNHLNQGEMAATQFAFVGLVVTYPKFFGVHGATDDDIEAFCHAWRGIGYLLGVDDEYNYCRGTLGDVRLRTTNLLEHWVKPNLRDVNAEWEHMMRCAVEGLQYYFPGSTYELYITDLARLLNLHLPRYWGAMPYVERMRCSATRFYFEQCCKVAAFRGVLNYRLKQSTEKAKTYGEAKRNELEQRSARTLEAYRLKLKQNNGMEKCPQLDHMITRI